jgi:hypothetical protein
MNNHKPTIKLLANCLLLACAFAFVAPTMNAGITKESSSEERSHRGPCPPDYD